MASGSQEDRHPPPLRGHRVKELNLLLSFYTAMGTTDSHCASRLSVLLAYGSPDRGKPQAEGGAPEGSTKANAEIGHKQESGDQERVVDYWGSRDSEIQGSQVPYTAEGDGGKEPEATLGSPCLLLHVDTFLFLPQPWPPRTHHGP